MTIKALTRLNDRTVTVHARSTVIQGKRGRAFLGFYLEGLCYMSAQAQTSIQKVMPPASLKQGYDSVTGAGRSTAIVGEADEIGGTSTLQVTVATTIHELTEALGIDQSLSVSYGPIASGDQKLRFVRNLEITSSSISIVVYSLHLSRIQTLKNFSLDPHVQVPTDPNSITKFFNAYGDSFISSRTLGGEYYAVFTFFANDMQEQIKLKADLQASGIYNGVSANAEFQVNFSRVTRTATTRTNFVQSISGIENPVLPSPDEIVEFATKFTSLDQDMEAVIDFSVTGYENVLGLSAMGALAANRIYFIGDESSPGLGGKLGELIGLRNKIDSLLQTYQVYGGYVDNRLTAVRTEVECDIGAVNNQIYEWEKNPVQNFPALAFNSLKNGSPSISVSVGTFGPYGGNGGNPFDDVPDPLGFIASRTHLISVGLRGGEYVDQLLATYLRENNSWNYKHGGNGGGYKGSITIAPNSPVTAIAGRAGRYVDHLTISTSSSTLDGGGDGGNPFSTKIPAGNFLLGFRGRSGDALDQIIIVYAGFAPATWK